MKFITWFLRLSYLIEGLGRKLQDTQNFGVCLTDSSKFHVFDITLLQKITMAISKRKANQFDKLTNTQELDKSKSKGMADIPKNSSYSEVNHFKLFCQSYIHSYTQIFRTPYLKETLNI